MRAFKASRLEAHATGAGKPAEYGYRSEWDLRFFHRAFGGGSLFIREDVSESHRIRG